MSENTVTLEQFAEMKKRFHGKMEPDEAAKVLRAARRGRQHAADSAAACHVSDTRPSIRSVQSTMARFRRAVGLDPERGRARD